MVVMAYDMSSKRKHKKAGTLVWRRKCCDGVMTEMNKIIKATQKKNGKLLITVSHSSSTT